jgi:NAD-dependent SIR2 family protein deacetylase
MSELKKYYGDGSTDLVSDHKINCICCGGQTHKETTIELDEDPCDLYRCRVCSTKVAQDGSFVYLEAEPERFEHVISDEHSEFNWN